MKEAFTILIADRNPHVRSFLQREMTREGYQVHVAEKTQDVLRWIGAAGPVHLVIFDPDLADAASSSLLEQLQQTLPATSVVIHTHYPHALPGRPEDQSKFVSVVEKSGNSIERLKQIAADLFGRHQKNMSKTG